MNPPRVLRVDETAAQRGERLRREMHAVGSEPQADKTEQGLSDEALAKERAEYASSSLEDVFEREAKVLLSLPTTGPGGLWPKDRAQVLRAITGFLMMKHKIGPTWGTDLDATDETPEEPEGE